jgi:hypothetical protein
MDYRSYDLEEKKLMVGSQVTITKEGTFIRNGSIFKQMSEAVAEAQAIVDGLLLPAPK